MKAGRTGMVLAGVVLCLSVFAWAEAPPVKPYRGFTICQFDRETLEDAKNNWHANQVRYMIIPGWGIQKKGETSQQCFQRLLQGVGPGLDIAKELGLAVVLDLHLVPNDNPSPVPPNPNPKKYPHWNSTQWWNDGSNLRVMIECWRQLAEICKDRDQEIWFDLFNEPLEWSVVHNRRSYPPKWPVWAQRILLEIRKIDKTHPVVIEPGPGMLCWGFRDFPPLRDPYQKVIYSVHFYQPLNYTHQGINGTKIFNYPGSTGDGGGGVWNAARLEKELAPAIEFQKKHDVRIYVGEFSAARWAPNAERYLRDSIEIFEKYGWDWNYHALRESGVWSLLASDLANLVRKDKNGKEIDFHALARPAMNGQGIMYRTYGSPPAIGNAPDPQGLTKRGKVVLEYMKRNLSTTGSSQPANAEAETQTKGE